MLKKHREFYSSLLFIQDTFIISLSWLLAFYLRMYVNIIPVYKGIPRLTNYLLLLALIIVLWRFISRYFRLYRVTSTHSMLTEIFDVVKATAAAVILLVVITYFFRQYQFSRLVFLYFWVISAIALSLARIITRDVAAYYQKRGYNLRHVLIVGAGELSKDVAARLERHPELGLHVVGFLADNDAKRINEDINGSTPIIGRYEDVRDIIKSHDIELVIIALALEEQSELKVILKKLAGEMVDIKLVPDFFQFIKLRGETEEFDGLTFINVQTSPLYGWNVISKRICDVVAAAVATILLAPLMILIVILIKTASRGPFIYKQARVGLDGRVFDMYKFRSMKVDAEYVTGPVWATQDDPRRTPLGKILRRLSLDELPQLFNVLKGEMSLVGPRPERPMFIEKFKEGLPRYMLRHKVKAGMTGWAQVNGWRGDTSIEKRIEYDLYYIENWSIGFDFKIVCLTLWKGIFNKNAY